MTDAEGPDPIEASLSTVSETAIEWYAVHARNLPWRRPGVSPWAVLVSEVMLQQTQVSRVEPIWLVWHERWPTPASLAAESVAEAIRAWGRLGYPRRAVRLHTCSATIVDRHDGLVPSDLASLLDLPGIGTYTARAVAAFAFRQRHPVVDTNVRRLVSRAIAGNAEAGPATTAADLVAVERLLPVEPEAAATASIAFMELGAVVCTAKAPRCPYCPLQRSCAWRATGSPGDQTAGTATSARGAASAPRRPTQRYLGSDRHVRGLLLAALRDASVPVPASRLDLVWHEAAQRDRALAGLVTDGLAQRIGPDHYALPV